MIPPLPFTEAESNDAHKQWGANCGPHALAAACGTSLIRAVETIPDFIKKRYTNPTMMQAGLRTLDRCYTLSKNLHVKGVPENGLARIQWEGRWTRSDAPPIAAYAYTHWVGARDNYIFCTASGHFAWIPFCVWQFELDALCDRQKYTGWHVTHQYLFI
jgi:hypothetical protein